MNGDSIFTKIIKREISAEIIWENEKFIAFLDINPIVEGHTLLVPKKQVDKFYDLDEDTYFELFNLTKIFAKNFEEIFKCKRVGIIIEGFGVPHVHVHILPLNHGGIIETKKLKRVKNDLKNVGNLLRENFKNLKIQN